MPRTDWLISDEDFLRDERLLASVDAGYQAVDLARYLAEDYRPPTPMLLRRSDGRGLLYPAKRHWLQGEPESGKSWLALFACAEVLWRGGRVVYFDWESDAAEITGRLRALGVGTGRIASGLHYISPPGPFHGKNEKGLMLHLAVNEFYDASTQRAAELVVFDACAEAMTVEGLDENSNRDVETWWRGVPTVALQQGCAVLVIDHVTKSDEGRGRWARGAGHKLGLCDTAYRVDKVAEFAPGLVGKAQLSVAKDRPGGVRSFAVGGKGAGLFILDATDSEALDAVIHPNLSEEEHAERARDELLLRLEQLSVTEPLSKSALAARLGRGGRAKAEELIRVGALVRAGERRGHDLWRPNLSAVV